MSTVRISEYTGDISGRSGSFDYVKVTGHITASNVSVDANTLFIGGTSFSKTHLDDLKAGKSLNSTQLEIGGTTFTKAELLRLKEGKTITTRDNNLTRRKSVPQKSSRPTKGTTVSQTMDDIQKVDALVNTADDTSFIQSNVNGEFDIVVNNTSSIAITTESVDISVPVFLPVITGSTEVTGSLETQGSVAMSGRGGSTPLTSLTAQQAFDAGNNDFGGINMNPYGVVNLLDLLANWGSTGIPTGSDAIAAGNGGVSVGDINLDGQVNVTDLMLLLAGYGNPNLITQNLNIPDNTNYQLIGPIISVSSSVEICVGNNSFLNITSE